jgi:tripartite motif-containing protein 35
MEHALREKAKAFWTVRRSYEAIAKHNQVSECWSEWRVQDVAGGWE